MAVEPPSEAPPRGKLILPSVVRLLYAVEVTCPRALAAKLKQGQDGQEQEAGGGFHGRRGLAAAGGPGEQVEAHPPAS